MDTENRFDSLRLGHIGRNVGIADLARMQDEERSKWPVHLIFRML